jgi:hypothetical protein
MPGKCVTVNECTAVNITYHCTEPVADPQHLSQTGKSQPHSTRCSQWGQWLRNSGNYYTLRIATRLRAGRFGVRILRSAKEFSVLQKRADRPSDPHSLLYSGYRKLNRWCSGQGVMLTTHFHLSPRLRISGSTLLLIPYALMAFIFTYLMTVSRGKTWTGRICVNMLKTTWNIPEGQTGLFGSHSEHYHSAEY